jgi:3-hydroxyacyl-[acyl-carrier-protein] dehydratase
MIVEGREIASVNRIIYSHVQRATPDELRRRFRYYGGIPVERGLPGERRGP